MIGQTLLGIVTGTILILNTIFWGLPVIVLGLIKLSSKNQAWQSFWSPPIVMLCSSWAHVCMFVESMLIRIQFNIEYLGDNLSTSNSYLVIGNHQSMADIPVLMKAVHGKIPFMRFFAKAQLKKVPIFGFAWRSVDCPFMHRYSKEYLDKNPHLKGQDLLKTIESCQRLRFSPVSITNFLEGTRLTQKKHAELQSPYQYLLPPRAGGVALAIAALEGQLTHLVDVVIYYHQPQHELWDYLSGRIKEISIQVKVSRVPVHFYQGDYQNDPAFRQEFQTWLNQLWLEKDAFLTGLNEANQTKSA